MNKLLSKNNEIVYVNDSRELKGVQGLANKRLCIIKTDFKDINKIKKICKSYPKLEVWLACEEISRKNVITANMCGIKNVIQYPIKEEVILDLLNNKELTEIKNPEFEFNKNNNDLKGLKVMVVDDNRFNTELLEETLKPLELNVITYQKPKLAAEAVHNEKFDLFLLDIMMPEMSGYELAKIIKDTELNCNVPIVFISALSDNENKLKSFNLGSYIYVEKPFNVKIFKSQISSLLREYKKKEQLAKLQQSYLAMITHDMKGPVQAEITALKLLLNKENFDKEQRDILYEMLSTSKYLQNLVSNVLEKYKCDNGKLDIVKEKCSLKKIINECCEEIKYIALEKNLSLKVSYKAEVEELELDYNEIKRVMHNLLANSLKYSYTKTDILIDVTEDKSNVSVSIKNFGKGVCPDKQENIFDKFISYSEKQKSVSSGLGLYISKQIVLAHNGTIKFESIPEQHTTITFSLPK